MTSKMAIEDIYTLKKEGVDVTPEQIVALNELGLKVERPDTREGMYNLPRCAFVNDVVFTEPTIGAEIWYEKASRLMPDDFNLVFSLRVLETTVRWDLLPDPSYPDSITMFIEKMTNKLKGATYKQVFYALNWVLFGNKCDIIDDEDDDGNSEEDDDSKSFTIGLVHQGQALGIGTLQDLQGMTSSALLATVREAMNVRVAGMADIYKKNDTVFGKYMKYLDKIRKESKKVQ